MTHVDRRLYATLGVDPCASASEIKSAFRARAKLMHPDGQRPTSSARKFRVRRKKLRKPKPARAC